MTRFVSSTPCPACGRPLEAEEINVISWHEPDARPIPGRPYCPSGCDPRFRRFVIAGSHHEFRIFCRESGWNPNRVVFVHADHYNLSRAALALRGCVIHRGMIDILPCARLSLEASSVIEYAMLTGDGARQSWPSPRLPGLEFRYESEDRGFGVSSDVVSRVDQTSRYQEIEAEIRETRDHFHWDDAMAWSPGEDTRAHP